mgnify:CR=1 FL=1
MFAGYRGWDLSIDGIVAESFITGREFTTMITGSSRHPEHCRVYYPVERVFHASLPDQEKFLSFDRLWEIYEEETPMCTGESTQIRWDDTDAALKAKGERQCA